MFKFLKDFLTSLKYFVSGESQSVEKQHDEKSEKKSDKYKK